MAWCSASRFGILVGLVASTGCTSESDPPKTETKPPPIQTCFAPEDLGGRPQTISDAVEFINALPQPVTVPCLLQALERPFQIDATQGVFSLQPAFGPNNPRYFISMGALSLSVVPKGDSRPLVEFGETRAETRTVKGEVEFPVNGTLDPASPYERILEVDAEGTKCAFCHFGELADSQPAEFPAFVSDVVPILPNERVDFDYLKWTYEQCDADDDPDRCAMLDAIFAFGEVESFQL